MDEPAAPRLHRGAQLDVLTREDLDAYGVAELQARIGQLQDEIERTRTALTRKTSGRKAADALFSLGGT
jgi:uncharacterized small protein (DUF1192 family)